MILAALLLLSIGCDRFQHNFQPPEVVDFEAVLFTPLAAAFDASSAADLAPVMAFYAEDYMHFGISKSDRQLWLEGIYALAGDPQVQVSLLSAQAQGDTAAVVNWRLQISSSGGREVLADSTFTGERLALRNGNWLLKGNQLTCVVPTPKQRIIIEYFSFLGCPNCPVVEAKLHELQLQYPDQLSYLEHHTSGPLVVPGDNTFAYYGYSSVPASVFQGEVKLVGSTTDILDQYSPLVQTLSQVDAPLRYSDLAYSVDGQTITGSVRLEALNDQFDPSEAVLNCVLIERESPYTNTVGENLRNLVRAKTVLPLSGLNLAAPIPFTLESSVPIPDDASLVVFAQYKPSPFANNATIQSGTEVPLSKGK